MKEEVMDAKQRILDLRFESARLRLSAAHSQLAAASLGYEKVVDIMATGDLHSYHALDACNSELGSALTEMGQAQRYFNDVAAQQAEYNNLTQKERGVEGCPE